ncbi:MAG: DUF3035 domain-containing protein [Alphaproteobacteria bacterium]|nr:DUF3035 domain-containing protein [Alphaproteobacteria bacterium]
MRKEIKRIWPAGVVLSALALSACSGVKQEMGVGRHSPDAFDVVTRAPLTLPPDYALRPPENAGVVTPAAAPAPDTAAQVKDALMGQTLATGAAPATPDPAAVAFADKLGVPNANPDIRQLIDQDNGYLALKNRPVTDKLIFWKDAAPSANDIPPSLVDPAAEAARIKKDQSEGKPINTGDVPTIEQKSNLLDKVF